MSEEDLASLTEIKMKRLRNLRMFKGKTDEDIFEFYRNRAPQPVKPPKVVIEPPTDVVLSGDEQYEKTFKSKLKAMQSEFAIDMNNANDVELLRSLVRHLIQQETVNTQITRLQRSDNVDTRTLKNLGDYQRSLVASISEIQEKLGISRKQRKDQDNDSDVPTFIADLKARAKDFFDKSTTQIRCEKCGVELARYWLNFPTHTKIVHIEAACWKCGEERIYTL